MLDAGLESRMTASWRRIYLRPSEMHLSDGRAQAVTTVLGSCVSVTFFAPQARIGGITHALLPLQASSGQPGEAGRFVDSSIRWMVEAFRKRAIKPDRLELKVFGGAQMRGFDSSRPGAKSVGRQNVEAALMTIDDLGLRLLVSEVGGSWGRKMIFFPHLGEVWIKKISRTSAANGEGND